ncbi:MAG: hypothetical protein A2676_04330 [Candidatus Sungbacteria bacterium RIFCSPHIGHO2_01_FULL_51_22]|uniref:Pseudouridine synthase n=1 Tax=Candidatus Sungbacteria bacterium RIFCSPHIGHO2_02_FULL_51_29 TaxID=1802273 RepID=A0A1G2KU75_9BACT|nr:MAG: hypothetical protein A2676_04330 [Candidatus Sungbacteria bacterium RIFCSPHIGHO2_01_FULL_51_22]OHA03028.1 MAG: hypothetical protein A3C16_02785 [Candidatus Sungbacteria bacterium RIFCSPHIGHO2_02_FULL_51_29]
MRINKYLASKGYGTRRGADELIERRQVFINGRPAVVGDKIQKTDTIEVRMRGAPKEYVYVAYNKPAGIITPSAQRAEKDTTNVFKGAALPEGLFPLGRLDKESHGLMILTNDGRLTDRLLNPDYGHEKEYVVRTTNKIRPSFKQHMEAGVDIGGYTTKPCVIHIRNDMEFTITLTEGKKHQIRRMCAALHNDVTDLKRIRIMNIMLGSLAKNAWRPIAGPELAHFLKSIGL